METETLKALTRALKDYQVQLDDKNALIRAYEQKINDLRDEKGQYKDSAEHWLSMWRQATSEAKEAQE